MDSVIIDEILEELSSTLQKVESQSAAVLELIKDKGIVREEELAPYLERASAASSVRSRATRVRLAALLAGLDKSELQAKEPEMAEKRDKTEAPAQSSKLEGSADKRQQTIDEAASQEQGAEKTHPEKAAQNESSEPGRRTTKNPEPSKLAG